MESEKLAVTECCGGGGETPQPRSDNDLSRSLPEEGELGGRDDRLATQADRVNEQLAKCGSNPIDAEQASANRDQLGAVIDQQSGHVIRATRATSRPRGRLVDW